MKFLVLAVLVPLLGLPPAALSADSHRQAVLRLVAVSGAIAEEVRALQDKGHFAIEAGSRMPAGECGQLFQDLVSLKNLEVVDRIDPAFREWREDGRRQVAGTIVLRWRGKQELRLRVQTMGSHQVELPDAEPVEKLARRLQGVHGEPAFQGMAERRAHVHELHVVALTVQGLADHVTHRRQRIHRIENRYQGAHGYSPASSSAASPATPAGTA